MKTKNVATVQNTPLHTVFGVENVVSWVWKLEDEKGGWHYRYNIFRVIETSGRVSQRFTPRDLPKLLRMARALAETFSDDSNLGSELRDDMGCLAACLERVLPRGQDDRTPTE